MSDLDYILGTHDEEIERLGLQHRVWRPDMLACWSEAVQAMQHFGKPGARIRALDVGCGPGYATSDLAEAFGPPHEVIGLERSDRFIQSAKERCLDRSNVFFRQVDLVEDELGLDGVDFAWCRWVLAFLAEPSKVIAKLAAAMKPGGVFAIHDYIDYRSWRPAPRRPLIEEFVAETMASWEDAQGDPDIGLRLPTYLAEAGFEVVHARPIVHAFSPDEEGWKWPEAYILIHAKRLVELRGKSSQWADDVVAELRKAEADPCSLMITPMVIELVAVKTS